MNNYRNELKRFFTEYWKYLAVNTACKLDVFDLIQQGFDTPEKITKNLNANNKAIKLLLSSLANIGFVENNNGIYSLNSTSVLLTENNNDTLKNACILWGMEHMDAWQNLDYTIKTGSPAFLNSKQNYFEYLSDKPYKLENYHKAMHEYAIEDYKNICEIIDFNKFGSVMDIGGGLGALISIIKNNTYIDRYYLFEKPEVIELSKVTGIEKIKGDFFKEIPKKTDCLVLSRVIHDWDDNKANIILKNCYDSLPINGEIILIENFTNKIKNEASLLSLNMMIMCESYERTELEYKKLLEKNGFKIKSTQKINNLQYSLKAIKL